MSQTSVYEYEPFWLIWNENGHAPTKKHSTWESARNEARRLAMVNPGEKFHILGSLETCEKLEVVWTIHRKTDECPF